MEKIKNLDEDAWKDMCEVPPSMWTRAGYSTHTCCDLQVNNMCEAFNRAILEYRDKPIISVVEGLKFYISNKIVKQRDLMLRYRGNICPMIQQKLEINKKDADGWVSHWVEDVDYAMFEVSNANDKFMVNLAEKTCSCRRWDLSGIPCCHSIACMWFNNQVPEDFVNPYYRKSTFFDTYKHIILPCNGPRLWPVSNDHPINPPYMTRAPGRPKKARRKNNDEPRDPHRFRRQQATVRCKRCGSLGHNNRTCIGKTATDRTIPKGGNKSKWDLKHSLRPQPSSPPPSSPQPSRPPPTRPHKLRLQLEGAHVDKQEGEERGKSIHQCPHRSLLTKMHRSDFGEIMFGFFDVSNGLQMAMAKVF